MAFEELLDKVGGLGKFQILQMALFFPFLMLGVCQVLLENFTAAIPGHRCWVHILDNDTVSDNGTGILSPDVFLRISIPLDSNLKPEKCHCFLLPQWQLLHLNGTLPNMTHLDTEPCVDGWVYDQSSFHSTIVTEVWEEVGSQMVFAPACHLWDLCSFAPTFLTFCSLHFWSGCSTVVILINTSTLIVEWTRSQSKAMVITLVTCATSMGQIVLGGLAFVFQEWRTLQLVVSIPFFVFFISSRWLIESARWLIITNKPDKSLKELKKVAQRNGIKNAEAMLNMEGLRSAIQKELEAAQTKATVFDLFRTPNLRKRICLLLFVRFANTVPVYGISLNLQHFGSNIFLFQVIFGALTALVRSLVFLVLKYMGRRPTQTLFLFLVGLAILVNMFVPQEMQTLRVTLASLGVSFVSASVTSFSIHSAELIPTLLRTTASGLEMIISRCGAALAPLLMTLVVYRPTLPWIIYGVIPIIAGFVAFFLPETRNLPLPDTIQDVEDK
ncbi:solute carrier family 22 member 10 [Camelus ferus]|nr:solute carrier family 22 member 10 [Camelus ferus]